MGHVNGFNPFFAFIVISLLDAFLYLLAYLFVQFLRSRRQKTRLKTPKAS
jgi:hypothetical protein